ncbi:MAG TPA: alpha/beta hydrolase [Erythrobacter sp.]|nr:alpha/beta hydrolase [Erythrobacter sp.]
MKKASRASIVIAAILVMAVVLLRSPDTDPAEMRAKYGAPPSQFVELDNGLTVHLRDEGPEDGNADAKVIVLLHGSNADLHTWQPWVDALRPDYRVIRLDQRGHGLTGAAQDNDYQLESFTGDLSKVLDSLGVDRFVLAGNSMGGWIAAGYALANPDRLTGLVLVDASGAPIKRESEPPLGFQIAQTPGLRDLAKHFLPRSVIESSLSQSVANQEIVTDEEVDRYWELARYPGNREATMHRFRTERREYTAEEISALRVPTLVMWGEKDSLIPLAAGEWYAQHLPNSKLVTYPEFGHIPQQENPVQSAADLRAWLTGLTAEN